MPRAKILSHVLNQSVHKVDKATQVITANLDPLGHHRQFLQDIFSSHQVGKDV
jgi:hypothetical protein